MATRAQVREAARSQATRSGRVPQSAIDEQLQSFDNKDLRLRSVGKDVRKRPLRHPAMAVDNTIIRTANDIHVSMPIGDTR